MHTSTHVSMNAVIDSTRHNLPVSRIFASRVYKSGICERCGKRNSFHMSSSTDCMLGTESSLFSVLPPVRWRNLSFSVRLTMSLRSRKNIDTWEPPRVRSTPIMCWVGRWKMLNFSSMDSGGSSSFCELLNWGWSFALPSSLVELIESVFVLSAYFSFCTEEEVDDCRVVCLPLCWHSCLLFTGVWSAMSGSDLVVSWRNKKFYFM